MTVNAIGKKEGSGNIYLMQGDLGNRGERKKGDSLRKRNVDLTFESRNEIFRNLHTNTLTGA